MDKEIQKFIGKTIAILGYRDVGPEWAKYLRNQGVRVVIGAREYWDEGQTARADGFEVLSPEDATEIADIIQVW